MDDPGLLTEAEHKLMDLLGEVADRFRMAILDSSTEDGNARDHRPEIADFDWNEVAAIIHQLQAKVMSQAAARTYPDRYRRLGGPPPRIAEHHYRPTKETADG